MSGEYNLTIEVEKKYQEMVCKLINIEPTILENHLEFAIDQESKGYWEAILYFIDFIENNIDKLQEMNVKRENMTIWILYAYENQCNLEFDARILKKLGECGVSLCISCWEE